MKLLILAIFAVAGTFAAPVTVFSNRGTWETASGATNNIDFEGLAAAEPVNYTYYSPLSLPGVTFSAPETDSDGPGLLFVVDPAVGADYDWDSGDILDVQDGFGTVLMTFDAPVSAFGTDVFSAFYPGIEFHILLSTGEGFDITTGLRPDRTFSGVNADDAIISWARFTPQQAGADGGLDNVSFTPATVPEPATGIILGLGIAMLGAAKRARSAGGRCDLPSRLSCAERRASWLKKPD